MTIETIGRRICHPMGLTGPWTGTINFGDPRDLSTYRTIRTFKVRGECETIYAPIGSFACITVWENGRERRHWRVFDLSTASNTTWANDSTKTTEVFTTATSAQAVAAPQTSEAGWVKLEVVRQQPAPFTLPYQKLVILADNTCGEGKAKLLMGGEGKAIPRRTTECLPIQQDAIQLPLVKQAPPNGTLPWAMAVIVVDGSCQAADQAKVIVGGGQSKSDGHDIPRGTSACVAFSSASSKT